MYEDKLLLQFENAPERYPDTAIAARALLDWVDLIHKTVAAIDPAERVIIEIAGVTEGSTRFPQILKFVNDQTGVVREAWAEYPHLKSIVAGAAHTFYTSVVAASVTLALQPAEQVVRLSDRDRALLAPLEAKAAASPAVRDASKRFYRTLESDPGITGVGVSGRWAQPPAIIIPRSEFSERSGLWEMQQEAQQTRPQRDVWNVVLLRPALVSKPQAWQFSRDGLKFNAKMADAQFLLAIREGRIPITLQEGVVMRVEIEYQEMLKGQAWETDPRSRRIVHVLSPTPRPQATTDNPRR